MDSSRIEITIQKLLQDYDAAYAADNLLKKWDRGELSEKEQEIVGQFLINAGLFSTLQNQYSKQLTQDRYIAWIPLLEMISRITTSIPDSVVDPVLLGMTENNKLEEIVYIQNVAKIHPRFQKLIEAFQEEQKKQLEEEKQNLKRTLQRHINDRMDTQVRQVSELLMQKFPNDKDIQNMTADIELIRIRSLIQKKERDLQQSLPEKQDDALAADRSRIAQDVLKNAKSNPAAAYDLAILLTQMEVYDEALQCLSYAQPSLEKDWLKLDLLIKCGNYIDAISESFEIEKKYSEDPETIFSTLEFRAQALYGLGEKDKAIQILETMLQATPKRQTARVLLHAWRNN